MAGVRVPPTWDISFSFASNKGRRVQATLQTFGEDFTDAMDNLSDSDLEEAGLTKDSLPDLADDETLVEVNLSARRR